MSGVNHPVAMQDEIIRRSNPMGSADTMVLEREAGAEGSVDLSGLLLVQRYTAADELEPDRPMHLVHAVDQFRNGQVEALTRFDELQIVDFEAELRELLAEEVLSHNLITQTGDQFYGERAAGIAGAPAQVTCMKLGTSTTATAKTSTGAALVSYKSGSDKAIDSSWPTSSLVSTSRQIQWKTTWGAGVVNGSALTEVVLVIDVLADATSTAANTIARALFGPMTLGALDTLAITWNHLLLGA